MNRLPSRYCRTPGCGGQVTGKNGYCAQCKARRADAYDQRRGTAWERGYDAQWRALRSWWIENHPICVECEKRGIIRAAEHVDHIKPFDGLNDLKRLDIDNLQSLCQSCHSKKTAREDGGYGHGGRG